MFKTADTDQTFAFGNALIEYDMKGRPLNKPRHWYNGHAAANGNFAKAPLFELEEDA